MEKFDLFFYENHYKDGSCRFQTEAVSVAIQENDDSYVVMLEPAFPEMVCEEKSFDANSLMLKGKGAYLKFGNVPIGVWEEYDEFGNVVDETDYEDGWKIGWNELLPILEENHIDLAHVVNINRFVNNLNNQNEDVEEIEEENKKEANKEESLKQEGTNEKQNTAENTDEGRDEVPNQVFDEVLFSVFGDEYLDLLENPEQFDYDIDLGAFREQTKPEYRWQITTLSGPRTTVDYYFDGLTGELIEKEQSSL